VNPYELLGVAKDATEADIRRAYRKAAKSAHPDIGGDAEGFDRLKLAHDVLMDADRRAHFDRTGDIKPTERDTMFQHAMALLACALDSVLGQLGGQVRYRDVVADLRTVLAHQEKARATEKQQIEARRAVLQAILDRFKPPAGKPNRLRQIVEAQLSTIEIQLSQFKSQAEVHAEAMKLLDGHRFDPERVTLDYGTPFGLAYRR
jgi:curved DNA-binding protein CbpA